MIACSTCTVEAVAVAATVVTLGFVRISQRRLILASLAAFVLFWGYVSVSVAVYRLAHPEGWQRPLGIKQAIAAISWDWQQNPDI